MTVQRRFTPQRAFWPTEELRDWKQPATSALVRLSSFYSKWPPRRRDLRKSLGVGSCLLWGIALGIHRPITVCGAVAIPSPPPVLTNAVQVLTLTREQAGQSLPVRLRGVVTYADAEWNVWFIQDGTAGLFILRTNALPVLVAGQQIELEGVSEPGGFAPIVQARQITLAGKAPLPDTRLFSSDELIGGGKDAQWVEVEGIVRSVNVESGHLHFQLGAAQPFHAYVPVTGNQPPPSQLVDARVRLRGVWSGTFNQRGQLSGYQLWVPDFGQISVVEPARAEAFALPTQPVSAALLFADADRFGHRIKVAGVVTAVESPETFYLQDASGGLRVHGSQTGNLLPGDRVEVAGFPQIGGATPGLEAAVVRTMASGESPAPTRIDTVGGLDPDWDARLVTLSGELINRRARGDHADLVLYTGRDFIEARLAGTNAFRELERFVPGSRLAVVGVCSVQTDDRRLPTSFTLLLRTPGDVQILEPAPWWTIPRVLAVFGLTTIGLLGWRVRALQRENRLREQYRLIVDHVAETVLVLDFNLRHVFASPSVVKLYGYPAEEFLQLPLERILSPDSFAQAKQLFEVEMALETSGTADPGRSRQMETLEHRKDGTLIWVLNHFSFIRDANGRVTRILCVAKDITERKEAVAALRRSELRLRTIIEAEPECVKLLGPDGSLLQMNPAGLKMIEADSFEQVANQCIYPLILPEYRTQFQELTERVFRGESGMLEFQLLGRKGTTRWLETHATPLRNERGAVASLLSVTRDITERRLAEETMRASQQMLQLVLDHIPQGVFWKDRASRLLGCNTIVARTYGSTTAAPILGKTDAESGPLTPEQAEYFIRKDREVMESGQPQLGIIEQATFTDGTIHWLETNKVPLSDASGNVIGVLGTWQDITGRISQEQLLAWEKHSLELIATRISLPEILEEFMRGLEEYNPGTLCSVLLLDADGIHLRHGAAPSLPPAYNRLIDGVAIGPAVGSCGTAAYANRQVIVTDIATDPLWADYRDLALSHGLLACWSTPIPSSAGKVLGTFAIYYREPRTPTPAELAMINQAQHLLGHAIERKQAELSLRESEDRYRLLVEESPDLIGIYQDGKLVFANATIARQLGATTAAELLGRSIEQFIHPEDFPASTDRIRRWQAGEKGVYPAEVRYLRLDGTALPVEVSPTHISFDEKPAVQFTARDITERKRAEAERAKLEAQLRQAQKMEAIGTLAGGVAHDFNNLLAAIMGNTALAKLDMGTDNPAQEYLDQIYQASERAKNLVQQILAFSRQHPQERRAIALDPIIMEAARLLQATIPASVEIVTLIEAGTPSVFADPTQIHQVLVNLATNAWHALDDQPGRIELQLKSVTLAAADVGRLAGRQPGRFVCLSVKDTGKGMDAATRERIFDPFFTTKGVGKGTGLGLSVVHGIVQQHDATITVASQPGEGTVFQLYFPAAVGAAAEDVGPGATPVPRHGAGQHILFLDDEESLVLLARRTLERLGYRVTGFTRAADALNAFTENPGGFDLVITDLNLPGTSGLKVAATILAVRPAVPVVLCSGFVTDEIRERAIKTGIRDLLHKPVGVQELSETIHHLVRPPAPPT